MKEFKKEKESETESSSECGVSRNDNFVNFLKNTRKIKLK